MTNKDLARILYEMSGFLDMADIAFKPRAYEKVAQIVESLDENVSEIYQKKGLKGLEKISGIGKGIAERIEEYIKKGHIKDLDKLKKKIPVDLTSLTAIEGVGPKMVKKLYQKLHVRNLNDLERVARQSKIRRLSGFGQKSEENILRGIEFVRSSSGRFLLGDILPLVRSIEKRLSALKEVKKVVVAGSIRRRKETVGDADVLVISTHPKKVMDYFVRMDNVIDVHAHGQTKSSVKLTNGMDVDLRIVGEKSFGAALNYFTGSKEHNIALRQIAIKKGYKLNEYGLFEGQRLKAKGQSWIRAAGHTEEELYKTLGIKQYIEPELREMTGEIEMARKGKLPELIGYGDLRGDLQIQTNWTDGTHSIEEMVKEAKRLGLEYIVITDHTKTLAMTGGHDEKGLLKQWAYIDKLNKKDLGVRVLKGAEVNILKDGSLDIEDKVLAHGDVIGAAVHSNFNMSKKDMTERIKRAIQNPHIDILFHPTGRLIQRREPYELDINKVIEIARKTGTVLEIDAAPDRLDFKDDHIRKVIEKGVKLAIDSDAHSTNGYYFLEFGIAQARRGWATKNDIINAWPLKQMLKMLKKGK